MYIGGIAECFQIDGAFARNSWNCCCDDDEEPTAFDVKDDQYMFGYSDPGVHSYSIRIEARVKYPNKLLNRLYALARAEYNLMQNNSFTVINFRHIDHATTLLDELQSYQDTHPALLFECELVLRLQANPVYLMGLPTKFQPECVKAALTKEYGITTTTCEKSDDLLNFLLDLDESHTTETMNRNMTKLLGYNVKWMETYGLDVSELDMNIPGTKNYYLTGVPLDFEPICVKCGLDAYKELSVYDCQRDEFDDERFLVRVDESLTEAQLRVIAPSVCGRKVLWHDPETFADSEPETEKKTVQAFVLRGLSLEETASYLSLYPLNYFKYEQLRNNNTTSSTLVLVLLYGDYTEKFLNFTHNSYLGKVLTWSAYMNRKRVIQCINCQRWGHGYYECTKPARCMKCALGHRTEDCLKNRSSPATCANCRGDHPANASICPEYLRLIRELDGVKEPPIPQDYGMMQIPNTPQALAA